MKTEYLLFGRRVERPLSDDLDGGRGLCSTMVEKGTLEVSSKTTTKGISIFADSSWDRSSNGQMRSPQVKPMPVRAIAIKGPRAISPRALCQSRACPLPTARTKVRLLGRYHRIKPTIQVNARKREQTATIFFPSSPATKLR